MKNITLIFVFFLSVSCTKPKTVFICGDHICVNKTEAQQYFEENLTLEVKVLKKRDSNEPSLIELNLREPNQVNKQVFASKKEKTNKEIRKLSGNEKKKIISNIKKKQDNKKIAQKKTIKENKKISKKNEKKKIILNKSNKEKKEALDICKILKECTIDEISKYLIKDGKKRSFPDITRRQ